MNNDASESGLEVVLDNRKLVIGFVLLLFICGCFFVIGFIEGKRQGFQEGTQPVAETTPKAMTSESQAPAAVAPASDPEAAKPAKEKVEEPDQQLDWYKNVNRKEGEPEKILPPPAASVESPKPEPVRSSAPVEKPKPKAKVEPLKPEPVTYTVQVGAFRQKTQADAGARTLRSKGFECRIELPKNPEDFYLLQVGRFHSRTEAVAMNLRLKKSGFLCFIKTN